MIYLATHRWRYKHMYIWSYVCVLGEAQLQPVKFGEDRAMNGEVISDLFDNQ